MPTHLNHGEKTSVQVQTGNVTRVKKIIVGKPVRRVTAGAFTLGTLAGVDLTGVVDGSMLVYNGTASKFEAKVSLDNQNTNVNGGNF
tara:strand:- start:1314 stop:1574 length:261 start_codon:yes stop_codon:yes gene_type:complete